MLEGIIKKTMSHVCVYLSVEQHALIQMTLNISFYFGRTQKATGEGKRRAKAAAIVYHYVNMTAKFIFVWSSGKKHEQMNGKK